MLAYWSYTNQVALTIEFGDLPLADRYEQFMRSATDAFEGSLHRLVGEVQARDNQGSSRIGADPSRNHAA
jgi:hypothetical protein